MRLFSPRIEVHQSAEDACRKLAEEIASQITGRARENRSLVLGLATGSTPIPLYRELIRLHRGCGLSFANVITFNLDEYYGLPADDPQSYHEFMRVNLFGQIDLPPHQTHIPDGMIPRDRIAEHCSEYEKAIADAGGIDLQILGIGSSGHIGFNEPPSSETSTTRLVALAPITRKDAANSFSGIENVPTQAITMGVKTILGSRQIHLMAWGQGKASIVARSLQEPPSPELPATQLQHHPDVTYVLDETAASCLTQ